MSQHRPPTRQELDVAVEKLIQHFGKTLQTRRKTLKRTLHDIHEVLGIDSANLSHFEKGNARASLTLRNFLRLKLYYDIAWQQLLGPLPTSTAERLITRLLQTPPQVQESCLFLLEYGLGEALPPEDPGLPPACLATSSSSA